MKTTPQWLLRRFAGRVSRVLQRHTGRAPALGIYAQTLAKSAPEFIEAHERATAFEAAASEAVAHRGDAIQSLRRTMRAWSAALVNDLKGFDASRYGDTPNVAEDVVNDAQHMLAVLAEHIEAGSEPLFYTETLEEDMGALTEAAVAELAQAGTRSAKLSELRTDARAKALAFHRDLIAFRKALRALVGSNHPDYQKLRVVRGAEPDPDDDVVEDNVPEGDSVDPVDDVSEVGEGDAVEIAS